MCRTSRIHHDNAENQFWLSKLVLSACKNCAFKKRLFFSRLYYQPDKSIYILPNREKTHREEINERSLLQSYVISKDSCISKEKDTKESHVNDMIICVEAWEIPTHDDKPLQILTFCSAHCSQTATLSWFKICFSSSILKSG